MVQYQKGCQQMCDQINHLIAIIGLAAIMVQRVEASSRSLLSGMRGEFC